jgi:hypothetical protein
VATNPSTLRIWAILDEKHSADKDGFKIAEYDSKVWRVDATQPEGAYRYSLAVDSTGSPAFASQLL